MTTIVKTDLGEIKGEITLLKWMLGFNLVLSLAILGKLLARAPRSTATS